jgi:mono/diheme cytochrome c family protein
VKRLAGVVLILALAACSKQEPPLAVKLPDAAKSATQPQPASVGAELARSSPAPMTPPAQDRASSAPAPERATLLKQGEELFQKTCATCHMADGSGVPNLQPQIVGSAWIANPDPQLLLSLILRGSAILGEAAKAYDNDMAPQDHLTDEQVAAVASFVRQHFATPPIEKPVTPAEVAIARKRPGLPE